MATRTFALCWLLLNLGLGALAQIRECPPAASISPCICESIGAILCEEAEIPFAEVFEALGTFAAETDQNYHWYSLTIYRSHNTVIPADAFGNITFATVFIHLNNFLTSIESSVFSKMAPMLENLWLENNEELNDEEELFSLLNSSPSLKNVIVIGSPFYKIPTQAFQPSTALKSFELSGYSLESIGERAFYDLDNLATLMLPNYIFGGTPEIHREAFHFKSQSNQPLYLSLWGWMNLPSAVLDKIDFGGFNGRNVTMDLMYSWDGVVYLSEATFQPFLDGTEGSQIYVDFLGNCSDCRHAWLVQKNLIDTRVRVAPSLDVDEVRCLSESSEYVSLVDQIFEHCN